MLWDALMRPDLWAATLAMATPIALPALGGTFSERSGVVNIAMEGIMLIGAFFGVLFSYYTNNAWFGLVGAIFMGAIISALFAYVTINLGADQVVVGMGVNIFAAGLTAFLLNTIFGYGGTPRETPALPNLTIPGISDIPFVGPVLGSQNVVVYLMLMLVIASHYFLFHTNLGLRLRAVGENPQAADTAGLNVRRLRYLGVIIGGMLSSLGGVYLALGLLNSFEINMSGGRGIHCLGSHDLWQMDSFWFAGSCLDVRICHGVEYGIARRGSILKYHSNASVCPDNFGLNWISRKKYGTRSGWYSV